MAKARRQITNSVRAPSDASADDSETLIRGKKSERQHYKATLIATRITDE
jgi:hypothetical protein